MQSMFIAINMDFRYDTSVFAKNVIFVKSTHHLLNKILCLFVCSSVCLFGIYRSPWEFFTHMETSPLTMEGYKFWPMLYTYGHWAMRVLWRATPTETRDVRLDGHLKGSVTLTPIAQRLSVELSLPVFTAYVCRCWDSNTQPSACGMIAQTDCAIAAVYICPLYEFRGDCWCHRPASFLANWTYFGDLYGTCILWQFLDLE